jgi:hypothetical protein
MKIIRRLAEWPWRRAARSTNQWSMSGSDFRRWFEELKARVPAGK